ncbi:MAG: DegT/DnrJ/EryC1/StrS family aminotransferase [Zetaproteobacteria bacterium]|nr:MAG: DegT/DnrJ/EryC1/StrS family aminotransferase [Zetaproteobacteria bacterium]
MIPFTDCRCHPEALRRQIDAAIARVLERGRYILGEEVATFEQAFARYLGSRFCIGVASGTDAITLALMALQIGDGAEVITTALTAYPTITGIERAGARPVVVDVDPHDGLIDPQAVADAITPRTEAIVAVHLYGKCCAMEPLQAIARRHGLALIEDCAQAVGATLDRHKAGTMGEIGCFSFYPTKNLGAIGDGGAVVTDSEKLAERLRMLRNYGQSDRYHHRIPGLNSRLDELQAAILHAKLPWLDEWNRRRREIAATYMRRLPPSIIPLAAPTDHGHVHHLFVVRTRRREQFMERMAQQGIATLIHYPVPAHRQPAMARHHPLPPRLPHAEQLADEVVSLPLHPLLKDETVETIIEAAAAAIP